MINVVIADDHSIVRRGFRQIIEETQDIRVVAEVADGPALLAWLRQGHCDIIVLDLSMPGQNGLELLGELRSLYPDLAILILSMHPEDQYAVRALKSGASGYMNKEHAAEFLAPALRKIASGGRYVSDTLAEMLAFNLGGDGAQAPHESLSNREFQVLVMLAQGKTASAIADDLSISVKTVSTYRARILEKLNLGSNAELVRYALEKSLI